MMDRAVNELDRAKGRMAGDIRNVIADGEDLLKAAANVSGEGLATARTKFDQTLTSARAALVNATQPVIETTRKTAEYTDSYVHGNPWTAIGVALAAGALIGMLAARR